MWSDRNSECGSSLIGDLNRDRWWTDHSFGEVYLHVEGKDGDTAHRVKCRQAKNPRLRMEDGELFWLIDIPDPEKAKKPRRKT